MVSDTQFCKTTYCSPALRSDCRLPPGLYFDIGSAWDVNSPTAPSGTLFDEQVWRTSFGFALTAETPLGNFSASYAIETDAEDFDDTEKFGISFNARF